MDGSSLGRARAHSSDSNGSSMEGFGVGDEELEEGVAMAGLGGATTPAMIGREGRRLSRDLEGGFMDDSSGEEEEEELGGRR